MKPSLYLVYGLLLVYYVAERRLVLRRRRGFVHVIHVNGVRGKTSVCRLLDAALRERYRVFTKTTGTDPRVIGVDGVDRPLRRLGPANLLEQLRVMRAASRQRAQILIVECMAVNPELQRVSQEQMLRADIGVITNVRHDHPFELGESLDEVADSLCATIPRHGLLFTADAAFFSLFRRRAEERGSRARLCAQPGQAGDAENRALARGVARQLGLSDEEIARGFARVQADFGGSKLYQIPRPDGGALAFLNLFSANDPDSSRGKLAEAVDAGQYERVCFVYNNRWDRPDRARLFARRFFPAFPDATVYLTGDNRQLVRRMLRGLPLAARPVRRWRDCLSEPAGTLLVGVGNIKGEAHRMIEQLEREKGGTPS